MLLHLSKTEKGTGSIQSTSSICVDISSIGIDISSISVVMPA